MDVIVPPHSSGHNGVAGLTNLQTSSKDKEEQDRMIAADVMTKFSHYASQSERCVTAHKQKCVTDSDNSNSNSNGTSSSSRTSKLIITSTTTDSITATTTIDIVNTNGVKITSLPYQQQSTTVTVHTSANPSISRQKIDILKPSVINQTVLLSSGSEVENGIPLNLNHEKQYRKQHKQELQSSSDHSPHTSTDNFLIVSSTNDSTTSDNSRKLPDNSVEQMIVDLTPTNQIRKEIEKSHESNFHNNDESHTVSVNINNSTTNNKTRKKSLPVLNARILKELLDSTNNQGLVYLIHPFNDNFLVRSINKKDFINSFLKVNQKLGGNFISDDSDVLGPPILNNNSENENPIWGIIKNNRTIHFFEPTSSKNLNNTNILTEQRENHRSSENNNSIKDLSNSVILNSVISEPSPNEKLASPSTLPLKKRKVADSLLSDYGTHSPGLPSSTFLVTPDDSPRLIKSVSQLAEECVRDRSVFIVSPSDVPKFVKTVSSNQLDERTNQQLKTNIEIALHQDEDGDLPLHIAAVQKDLKMVSLYGMLIQLAGKSVDRFNKKHLTPLHFCVKVKFLSGIEKLIQMGADVNTLDGNGQSALHIAVSNSDLECFDFVLQQCRIHVKDIKLKPNLNSHDYEGVTLLHTAVNNNNIEMIERLLQKGAELDAIDFKSGRTPLFYAVENNNIEIVEFLLEKRASVDIQNFAGNTAFLAASCRGYLDISKLLADNGADTRGLITPDEVMSNPKTTSAVKSQLKNKLVSSKASQILKAL